MDWLASDVEFRLCSPLLDDDDLRFRAPLADGTSRLDWKWLYLPTFRTRADKLEAIRDCLAASLKRKPTAWAVEKPVGVEVLWQTVSHRGANGSANAHTQFQ